MTALRASTQVHPPSAGSVAPTVTFSLTVTGAIFCVVIYCLIFVRCSGANSTTAVCAIAAELISAAAARIIKRFMRFLILLVFACPFDNVWEIQPFPFIIGTHDHTMTIIDEVLQ